MSCAAHLLFDTFSCSSYTLIYDQLTVVVLHFLKLLNQVATRERINKPESETVLFFSLFVSLLLFFFVIVLAVLTLAERKRTLLSVCKLGIPILCHFHIALL